jgi:hypothetical protein
MPFTFLKITFLLGHFIYFCANFQSGQSFCFIIPEKYFENVILNFIATELLPFLHPCYIHSELLLAG